MLVQYIEYTVLGSRLLAAWRQWGGFVMRSGNMTGTPKQSTSLASLRTLPGPSSTDLKQERQGQQNDESAATAGRSRRCRARLAFAVLSVLGALFYSVRSPRKSGHPESAVPVPLSADATQRFTSIAMAAELQSQVRQASPDSSDGRTDVAAPPGAPQKGGPAQRVQNLTSVGAATPSGAETPVHGAPSLLIAAANGSDGSTDVVAPPGAPQKGGPAKRVQNLTSVGAATPKGATAPVPGMLQLPITTSLDKATEAKAVTMFAQAGLPTRPDAPQELEPVELLVGVLSARANFQRRERLRLAWTAHVEAQLTAGGVVTRVVFIVGGGGDPLEPSTVASQLQAERAQRIDIVYLDEVPDGYSNSAAKMLSFYRQVVSSGLRFDALMKCDDDSFVDAALLLQHYLAVRAQLGGGSGSSGDSDSSGSNSGVVAWWGAFRFDDRPARPKRDASKLEDRGGGMLAMAAGRTTRCQGGKTPDARDQDAAVIDHDKHCYSISESDYPASRYPLYAIGPGHLLSRGFVLRLGGDRAAWIFGSSSATQQQQQQLQDNLLLSTGAFPYNP